MTLQPTSFLQGTDPIITVVDSARRRAVGSPDSALPCPRCAALVKGRNLARHLDRTHGGEPMERRDRASWSGPERLVARPLVILPLLAAALLAAAHRLGRLDDDRPLIWAGFAVGVGMILGAVAVCDTKLFRGRLTVKDGHVVLVHTLGLRRRRLRCIDRLEFGAAYERRPDPTTGPASSDGSGSVDVASGNYLRLICGRRHITVHCKHGRTLRRAWTGWVQTRRRRRWHITLDAVQFVELQYVLADLGLLTPREASSQPSPSTTDRNTG